MLMDRLGDRAQLTESEFKGEILSEGLGNREMGEKRY
jgi:hypothetical protein